MTDFITALTGTNGISSTSLWADVTAAAPLIVILVGFSFGYYIVRRAIKGASKGKARV